MEVGGLPPLGQKLTGLAGIEDPRSVPMESLEWCSCSFAPILPGPG